MNPWLLASLAVIAGCSGPAAAAQAQQSAVDRPATAAVADPPRDEAHPARNRQLLIPSRGVGMNALFLLASGPGPKPTMLLLHGLPGNERNFDLAQAVRRAGWNVLTFTYRGAWGSPGDFSLANAIEDVDAAMALLRSSEAAGAYNVDRSRLVIAGHSLGGFNAAMHVGKHSGVAGLLLIDAANLGVRPAAVKAAGAKGLEELEAGIADDFGNSLQGTSPKALAAEMMSHEADWDLVRQAPQLGRVPILTIYATNGIRDENILLAAALARQPGARVKAVELRSDHAFADHRIALATTVVDWLAELARQ